MCHDALTMTCTSGWASSEVPRSAWPKMARDVGIVGMQYPVEVEEEIKGGVTPSIARPVFIEVPRPHGGTVDAHDPAKADAVGLEANPIPRATVV